MRMILSLLALAALATGLSMPKLSLNERQLKFATKGVSTNCTVEVDTKNRKLYLDSDIGKFTIENGKVTDSEGKTSDSTPSALICLGNKEAPSDGPALMFAASGAAYLMNDNRHHGIPLDFMFNKHCWAKHNKVQYYLWFGNPQDNSGFMSQKAPDALPCKDGAPGNHYFVIAGMRQLLEEKKNSWIISMDISDTFFSKQFAHKNMLSQFLDDRYDFIGGATAGGTKVFINGAIVAYKNTPWAKNFAAEWFKNRCGPMNQLAMWASLFKLWHQEVPSWEYSVGSMSSYRGGAHDYARGAVKGLLQTTEEKEAHAQWSKNGWLSHSLSFPHVLIHANEGKGGADNIAWRADMNRKVEPFVCHNTLDRSSATNPLNCDAPSTMCVLPEQCQC